MANDLAKPELDALAIAALSDAELERRYELIPLVKEWVKAIEWQMYDRMVSHNAQMKRHKLVDGRKGNRKWADESAVRLKIDSTKGLKAHAYDYEPKLLSPTELERKVKDGLVGKDAWAELQALIERKPGKPTIAMVEDVREAVDPQQKVIAPIGIDDFETE